MIANKCLISDSIARSRLKIDLAVGEIWSGKIAGGVEIICDRGIVWLTNSHDSNDYLLHSQEHFFVSMSGKVVIQAITAAAIEMVLECEGR